MLYPLCALETVSRSWIWQCRQVPLVVVCALCVGEGWWRVFWCCAVVLACGRIFSEPHGVRGHQGCHTALHVVDARSGDCTTLLLHSEVCVIVCCIMTMRARMLRAPHGPRECALGVSRAINRHGLEGLVTCCCSLPRQVWHLSNAIGTCRCPMMYRECHVTHDGRNQ